MRAFSENEDKHMHTFQHYVGTTPAPTSTPEQVALVEAFFNRHFAEASEDDIVEFCAMSAGGNYGRPNTPEQVASVYAGYTQQVYYKFVKNGWLENSDSSYDRLGKAVASGRLAGMVSWTDIEDKERDLYGVRTYSAPEQMLAGMASKFHLDLWAGQPWRPEVWVEKKGMTNVVSDICNQLRVDFFACKGYNSLTESWKAGRRLADYVQKGQRPIIFYLGDHDPSGLDMVRNNQDQLAMFAGTPVMVVHLALTWDQVQALGPNLPPNPAKAKDARLPAYVEYMEQLGAEDPYVSWEVDALEPTYIRQLIKENVDRIRDERLWDQALLEETEGKRYLAELAGEV